MASATSSWQKAPSLRESFAAAETERRLKTSQIGLQEAEELSQDRKRGAERQFSAIQSLSNRRRETGGGRFGTLNRGNGRGIQVGNVFSGLDVANRGALRKARQGVVDTAANEERVAALVRQGRPRAEAMKLASGQGNVITLANGKRSRQTIDENGQTNWKLV